jgi:TrmH family RNA methyltransferase
MPVNGETMSPGSAQFDVVLCHMESPTHPATSSGAPRVSEHLTSRDNRWIKQFRAALAGAPSPVSLSYHESSEEIVGVEGARLVNTALQTAQQSGLEIVAVLVSESGARHLQPLASAIPSGARILSTSDRLFAHIAGTETPQGIAALVRPYAATFDDLVLGTPLIVVMLGVQDPGNVGAIIRTAEAFGATGIAVCAAEGTGTSNPFGPKAMRASAGSALRLPILRGIAAPVLLAQLRVAGVRVYATCPGDFRGKQVRPAGAASAPQQQALAPWDVDWRAPAALLMGNEGAGLPAEIVRSADALVRIPQANWDARGAQDSPTSSPVDSLNVAVAGGVLLYEAARQRGLA